ncbi:hypothetical protein FG386_001475 [Cryptosporidium ryanae]|uniref:uncharacterized protein n=1 Tax=Cryptosporidium ryanae TaxID=515981 RepID=UPI00351A6021|nr:hypothetical protein FG386_001475 [Cryptosporidium ryanae]
MDISNPEVVIRRRHILEGYIDFSTSLTTWDVFKNMLRKSSEMFVYCQEKKAVVCPAPRRRGVKEDGFIVAYNSGYIIGAGENEETSIENIGWIRKKFRQHDPNAYMRIRQINFILRIDIPYRFGIINLFKLYNKAISALNSINNDTATLYSKQFEILFDPELFSVVIINFQKSESTTESEIDFEKDDLILLFPDEIDKESDLNSIKINECCLVVSPSSVVVQKVRGYDHAIQAFQMLMKYINRNELLVNLN